MSEDKNKMDDGGVATALFCALDTDGDGAVSYDELAAGARVALLFARALGLVRH